MQRERMRRYRLLPLLGLTLLLASCAGPSSFTATACPDYPSMPADPLLIEDLDYLELARKDISGWQTELQAGQAISEHLKPAGQKE